MNYIVKKLIFAIVAMLALAAMPVLASEVTGNLNTGLGNGVEGVVITSPIADPIAGTYTSIQNVALIATGASSIRYTTDGATPTCADGQTYSQAVNITASKTLKAISCYPNSQFSSVVSYTYIINLTVSPDQMSSLLTQGSLAVPEGATSSSTPSLQTTQDIIINASVGTGASTVTLPVNTTITSVSGQNFDATALTVNNPVAGTLSGLTTGAVIDGSLQWGIVNLGLQFSTPITISIYVGDSFNGQTLNVVRSTSGADGWTSDGIALPATCIVSSGLCAFSATKASYYAVYHTTSTSGGGGGGGGGEVTTPSIPTSPLSPAAQKVDANKDNKIDVLDFNVLMVNWGSAGANSAADFNGDGKVDVFDFNLLMINWTL